MYSQSIVQGHDLDGLNVGRMCVKHKTQLRSVVYVLESRTMRVAARVPEGGWTRRLLICSGGEAMLFPDTEVVDALSVRP